MNEVTIHGNLTDEPTLHHSPNGVAVLTFSVAVTGSRFHRATNRWVDKAPVFHSALRWPRHRRDDRPAAGFWVHPDSLGPRPNRGTLHRPMV
jgi:hypothetical protein